MDDKAAAALAHSAVDKRLEAEERWQTPLHAKRHATPPHERAIADAEATATQTAGAGDVSQNPSAVKSHSSAQLVLADVGAAHGSVAPPPHCRHSLRARLRWP